MSTPLLLSPPDLGPLEEQYLLRALRFGWAAPGGPDVDAFESELASHLHVPQVAAVSSGTAALHLALLAVGVRPGDRVVVPDLTFVATANAVRYCGAQPVLVDVDPTDGTLDVDLLAEVLAGQPIRAVIPVDLFGRCADYTRIAPLCARFGAALVADAAESLGSSRDGVPAGGWGDIAAFSFNGNKIITTSGGGALASADAELIDRCRHLANQARRPGQHYDHDEIGYNYRLSNLLAALGRAQLQRLPELAKRRRMIRERYRDAFAGRRGVELPGADDPGANCWLTPLIVDPARAGWSVAALAADLADDDIETRPMWRPMHLQPAYADAPSHLIGTSDRLYRHGLVLPNGSASTDADLDRLFTRLGRFLDRHP